MLTITAFTAPDHHGGKGLYADQTVFKGDVVRRHNSARTRIYSLREYKEALAPGGAHARALRNHCYPAEAVVNGQTVRILLHDGDLGAYMNHSEEPNVGICPAHPDVMVALRHIKPGDELTCDYRAFVADLSGWSDVEHCASFLLPSAVNKKAA